MDGLASRHLRQVFKLVAPLILSGNGLGIDFLAVRIQADHNGGGPLAVLVVGVRPGLGAGDFRDARGVAVGYIITIDLGGVVRHLLFGNGVVD